MQLPEWLAIRGGFRRDEQSLAARDPNHAPSQLRSPPGEVYGRLIEVAGSDGSRFEDAAVLDSLDVHGIGASVLVRSTGSVRIERCTFRDCEASVALWSSALQSPLADDR
jgi:hypothetical protein